MLTVSDVSLRFSDRKLFDDVNINFTAGNTYGLIGANGAGKSTTLRTISGLLKPKTGTVKFEGQDIAGLPAQGIVSLGISQVPEGRRVFANMTVIDRKSVV